MVEAVDSSANVWDSPSDSDSCYPRVTTDSKAGSLIANLPSYFAKPPIEAVVFGWGVTEDGQLGMDSREDVHRPCVVESLLGTSFSGFQFNRMPIVAGSRNTLAVTQNGHVFSFGWNDRGTLGIGHRNDSTKPTKVEGLDHVHITQAAIGGWHCLALTDDHQVFAWGGNEYFQCGLDSGGVNNVCVAQPAVPFLKVRAVACGGMHSLALTTAGDVWQWGEPWGDFSMEIKREPKRLRISDVEAIACGAFHNLALTTAGKVYGWGTNDFGQLGTGDTAYGVEPRAVQGLEGIDIADIDAGGWHSLGLTSSGEVYTWGRGEYGRLGLNDATGTARTRPCKVPGLADHAVVQAACGGSHTMVLTDKGRLFIWGRHSQGRLGMECDRTVETPAEIHLPGSSDRWQPICIAAGGRHSLCMALPRHTINNHDRMTQSLSDAQHGAFADAAAKKLCGGAHVEHADARSTGLQQSPSRMSGISEGVRAEEGEVTLRQFGMRGYGSQDSERNAPKAAGDPPRTQPPRSKLVAPMRLEKAGREKDKSHAIAIQPTTSFTHRASSNSEEPSLFGYDNSQPTSAEGASSSSRAALSTRGSVHEVYQGEATRTMRAREGSFECVPDPPSTPATGFE